MLLLLLCAGLLFCFAPAAFASGAGAESEAGQDTAEAEDYIERSPVQLSDFLQDPFGTLWQLMRQPFAELWRQVLAQYLKVFLLLFLSAALTLLATDESWQTALSWLAAGGCFLLISDSLTVLVETIAERSVTWRDFLVSYIPVFSGLMISGGQYAGATIYSGLFLVCVCFLAEALRSFLLPVSGMYLAVSVSSVFSGSKSLCTACGGAAKLLRKGISLSGVLFSLTMGLQRVFAASADAAAQNAGYSLLTGAVPIVGSTVAAAARTVMAGLHLLQAGLGFSALVLLGAEFLPIYIQVVLHWLMLECAQFIARLTELDICERLMGCLAEFTSVLAAILALFFSIVVVSTLLMLAVCGGGA